MSGCKKKNYKNDIKLSIIWCIALLFSILATAKAISYGKEKEKEKTKLSE